MLDSVAELDAHAIASEGCSSSFEKLSTIVDDEDDSLVPDLSVGNELQLQLVAKGLRRKFGADRWWPQQRRD